MQRQVNIMIAVSIFNILVHDIFLRMLFRYYRYMQKIMRTCVDSNEVLKLHVLAGFIQIIATF